MRALSTTDLWVTATPENVRASIVGGAKAKILNRSGVINAGAHLKNEFLSIKTRAKGTKPLLNKVVEYTERLDKVVPFSFGDYGANAMVPRQFPLIPYKIDNQQRVYVNFSDYGTWANDGSYFELDNGEEDMYALLESGVISHAVLYTEQSSIINNSVVIEQTGRLYSMLFMTAFRHKNFIALTMPNDFVTDFAAFCAAKFCITYMLEITGSPETINQYAYKCIGSRTSYNAICEHEAVSGIDYTSLANFIITLKHEAYGVSGDVNAKIDRVSALQNFLSAWCRLFDERTMFMLEYFPYFLHFILGALHRRIAISGLYQRYQDIAPAGSKLYNAIVNII